MNFISKLFGRTQPPDSYENWYQAVIPEYIYLHEGNPVPTDVDKHKQWLKSFARWKTSYEGFLEIESALERRGRAMDELDLRSYQHYSALLLQSGQWHAILLTLVKDLSETERARQLADIDSALVELRKRLKNL